MHKEYRNFDWAKLLQGELTGLEREVVQEEKHQFKSAGLSPMGNIQLPYDFLAHLDLTVGTDNQGGYMVATELKAASFIDLLINTMKVK